MQRSHDSGEHDVSSDEEQRSNENGPLLNVKEQKCQCAPKERRQTYRRNMRKKRVFCLCFYFCIISQRKCAPFHKHNEQLNCLYPRRPKVQQATRLHWPCTTAARLKTINTRSERTQKGRNEVRSPPHSQMWLYNTNTFSSAIRINTCLKCTYSFVASKKRLSLSRALFFFVKWNGRERLQANVRRTLQRCLNPGWLAGKSLNWDEPHFAT